MIQPFYEQREIVLASKLYTNRNNYFPLLAHISLNLISKCYLLDRTIESNVLIMLQNKTKSEVINHCYRMGLISKDFSYHAVVYDFCFQLFIIYHYRRNTRKTTNVASIFYKYQHVSFI